MATKVSKKTLKAKADKLAGDLVRQRGYCELIGKDYVRCAGVLQWAHIVGRANHRLRWELWNALALCAGHHFYYTNHPWEWVKLIEQKFPENYKTIEKHRNELFDGNYERIINGLQEQKSQ